MAEVSGKPKSPDQTDGGRDEQELAKLGLNYLFQLHERTQKVAGDLLSFLLKTLFVMHGAAVLFLLGFASQTGNKDTKILAKMVPALSDSVTWFLIGIALCALAIFFAWGFSDMWGSVIQNRFANVRSVDSFQDIAKLLDLDLTKKRREKGRNALTVILGLHFIFLIASGVLFAVGAMRAIDAFKLLASA